MAYRDVETRKLRDRERFRKRTAERRAAGLCPRCGDRQPASGRSLCEPCAERRNRASQARDARLRAAGKPRRDQKRAQQYERERSRRRTAERLAAGLCTKCGVTPPETGRRLCGACADKRRVAERGRYALAKAAGAVYGGRNPDAKRRSARKGSRKRRRDRAAAGLCVRCGTRPAPGDGSVCEPCREARRVSERERYAARRAAGLCVACGRPAFAGEARCGVCAAVDAERRDGERKNAAARRRYAARRAAGRCTDCGQPSQGAARCAPCAKRSYERSGYFRGIPVYPTRYTVIELATGEDHGTFDSEAEVAACLAFAKLTLEQVEVLCDASVMSSYTTAWT